MRAYSVSDADAELPTKGLWAIFVELSALKQAFIRRRVRSYETSARLVSPVVEIEQFGADNVRTAQEYVQRYWSSFGIAIYEQHLRVKVTRAAMGTSMMVSNSSASRPCDSSPTVSTSGAPAYHRRGRQYPALKKGLRTRSPRTARRWL